MKEMRRYLKHYMSKYKYHYSNAQWIFNLNINCQLMEDYFIKQQHLTKKSNIIKI